MIVIGSDHAGYELKERLKNYLTENEVDYIDVGTYSDDRVDFPDIAKSIYEEMKQNDFKAIAICGTGIGISIAMNKFENVRCAQCNSEGQVEIARQHNDINVLALGGRTTPSELAEKIVRVFLNTDFFGDRYQLRNDKIHKIEMTKEV